MDGKKFDGKKFIWVTFQRKGYHFYPNAPEEVAYLRDRHRHVFQFKVKIEVFHDDREIEFHMFQNELESWYDNGVLELDHKSCEMLADGLAEGIARFLDDNPSRRRELVVEVSEDGECGAECHYVV
jgi:hypothetical protein